MAQFTIPAFDNAGEMRYQMGHKLLSMMKDNPAILALDADLRSSTGLHIIDIPMPDRVIKTGIAEQNLIALSAGLAQEGFIPFPCTFDAFSRRFMDQLYVSVCYSNLNVKVIGTYAGLFTGKAGATHQSDKELSLLLRIPNLTVIEPGFNLEMEQALEAAAEMNGPCYLRLVRCNVNYNEAPENYRFRIGKGITIESPGGKHADIGLLSTGFMVSTARLAAKKLKALGYSVRIDHHPSLKPFDRDLLDNMADSVSAIVTLENHCTSGGLFSLVAEYCVSHGKCLPVLPIGTDPEDFIHTGHVNDLLYRYRMTSDDVVVQAENAVKKIQRKGASA